MMCLLFNVIMSLQQPPKAARNIIALFAVRTHGQFHRFIADNRAFSFASYASFGGVYDTIGFYGFTCTNTCTVDTSHAPGATISGADPSTYGRTYTRTTTSGNI